MQKQLRRLFYKKRDLDELVDHGSRYRVKLEAQHQGPVLDTYQEQSDENQTSTYNENEQEERHLAHVDIS